jgi:hypothetical protein
MMPHMNKPMPTTFILVELIVFMFGAIREDTTVMIVAVVCLLIGLMVWASN